MESAILGLLQNGGDTALLGSVLFYWLKHRFDTSDQNAEEFKKYMLKEFESVENGVQRVNIRIDGFLKPVGT